MYIINNSFEINAYQKLGFKALPCDGNILNLHTYLYIISVCNIYLWPGICETVLGAGNTQLSATFLPALNLWLTIIWTGSKAQCQRIMLMKTINLGHRISRSEPSRTITSLTKPHQHTQHTQHTPHTQHNRQTSNSIFALQLQMTAINFAMPKKTKELL